MNARSNTKFTVSPHITPRSSATNDSFERGIEIGFRLGAFIALLVVLVIAMFARVGGAT